MNVVVAGGGTIAPIDDVRHLANVSTGRMAAMISEACLDRGATVWHIHTPSAVAPYQRHATLDLAADPAAELDRLGRLVDLWATVKDRLHLVPLARGTVDEYQAALRAVLESRAIEIAFLPIAVSDYLPEPVPGKIGSDSESLIIACRRAPKVIRMVRDWAPSVYLVGFKLLSGTPRDVLVREAERACLTNRADLTVANDLATVREGRHELHLVRPGLPVVTLDAGPDLALRLVDRAASWALEPGGPRWSAGKGAMP